MRTESWMSALPPLLRYWIRARDERHSSRNAPVAARRHARRSLFPDERPGLPELPSMRSSTAIPQESVMRLQIGREYPDVYERAHRDRPSRFFAAFLHDVLSRNSEIL